MNQSETENGINKERIRQLIKNLQHKKWLVRKKAASELEKLGEVVVPFLKKTLAFEDKNIKYWSCIVLARIGGEAISPLIEALSAKDSEMRAFAAKALAETRSEEVIDPLIKALGDETWSVRKCAAESLISMGQIVIKKVAKALKHKNEDVRYWATKVLGKIGSEGIQPLIILLNRGNKDMRYFAAEALGDTGDEKAVPHLIKALSDKSWSVRKNAARSLQLLGKKALPALIQALKSKNEDIRYWAARITGNIGKSAVTSLIKQLKDLDNEYRHIIRNVFKNMGEDAVDPLIEVLKKGTKEMRQNAAELLGNTKNPRAIPHLINALADESWFVRKNAAEALEEMGEVANIALIEALSNENEDIQFWAMRILSQRGITNIEPLLKILNSSNKNARFFALEVLAANKSPEIVQPLIECLKDESWPVRRKAAEILENMEEYSIGELLKVLKSHNTEVRYWTSKILKTKKSKVIPYILKNLKSDDDDTRLYTIYALSEIGDMNILKQLNIAQLLSDRNEWIRRAAITAIIEIAQSASLTILKEYIARESEAMLEWIGSNLLNVGPKILSEMFECIRTSKNKRIVTAFKTVLSEPNDLKFLPYYLKYMPDTLAYKDNWCAQAITKFGACALPYLIKFFGSKESDLKKELVCEIILNIRHTAESRLKEALDSKDENIRVWANKTLSKFKSENIKSKLRSKIKRNR